MKKTHELKTWPEYFEAIWDERKNFELRKNDRNFEVGDVLLLQEYEPTTEVYSGRVIKVTVTYILFGGEWGLTEGDCIMALRYDDFYEATDEKP